MASSEAEEILMIVELQLMENYSLAAAFAMMAYDYLLNFGQEIETIWVRKFTWMTLLYALLRYVGLMYGMSRLLQSLSIPQPGTTPAFLDLLNTTSQTVVIFLLQGLLAMRVYILYEKRKDILLVLVVGFLISQAMNILTGVMAFVVVPGEIAPIRVSGVQFYEIWTTSNLVWMSPAVNSIELAYELLLSGLAIRYSIKYLPSPFWTSPWSSTRTLAEIVVRDNLVYFLIALFGIGINMFNYVPAANNSVVYGSVMQVLQIMFLSMVGPWMALNLHEHHEMSANQDPSSYELTEVDFGSGPRSLATSNTISTIGPQSSDAAASSSYSREVGFTP